MTWFIRRGSGLWGVIRRRLGGGGSPTSIQGLGMFGGQFKIEDTEPEVPFLDLMERARAVALNDSYNYGFAPLNNVVSLVRASNVVTVTLSGALPGFTIISGQPVVVHCIPDPTFDVEGVAITVTDSTHFTYPCTGSNGTANLGGTSDVAGAVLARVPLGAAGHPNAAHRIVLTDPPPGASLDDVSGDYTVTFPGTPPTSITFEGCTTSGYTPGGASFNITVNDPALLSMAMNGISANNSYRNPRIIPVGADQSGATKMRAAFAQNCARGKYTRWMDAAKTNGNPTQKSWDKRPLTNFGTGLPYELFIAASNEMSQHSWFCLPTFAANDFVTGLATLAKNTLNGALDAVYEYSNEPWNLAGGFTQYYWLTALAKQEVKGIYHGNYGYSELASLTKAGGVATATLTHPLPASYVTGLHIDAVMTDADFNATDAEITVTGANTFTYPVSAGTESASSLNGQFFGNLSSTLLSGGNRNLNFIRARYVAKRVYEHSQLIKTANDGVLGGRAKVVFMWQCTDFGVGGVADDAMDWLVAQYGPLADWCYAIGGAPYPRGSGTTSAQLRDAVIDEMDNVYAPALHKIRYQARKHGVRVWLYEGGVDLVNVNVARTDAMYTSPHMRTAQEHTVRRIYASGVDLFMGYTTGQRKVGDEGYVSWGLGESIADLLPIGAATAPKARGLDDVILLPPPAIDDAAQLPGTVRYTAASGNSLICDLAAPTSTHIDVLNGTACFKHVDAFVEHMFWAPATGVRNVTIWGKHFGGFGSVNNSVRVYLNGTLVGTHALYDDGTDVPTGTHGGYASPTTIAVTVPSQGWHLIRVRAPSGAMPDRIGVSRVTA